MADRGRPKAELVLTDDERQTLERWARRPSSSQALAQRCRIVLGCAAGKPNKQVAVEVGVAADGGGMASTVCGTPAGGFGRRAAPGRAAHDHR